MDRRAQILGWTALVLSTALACFWGFWGSLEVFHEGWWMPELHRRLLSILAYLIPMWIIMLLTVLALRWPRLGAILWFLCGAVFSALVFLRRGIRLSATEVLSWLPLTLPFVAMGLLWWWGRPQPRRWALLIALALPLLTALACSIGPAWRVSQRIDDGRRDARFVQGNADVALVWAPAGPGWVLDAQHACTWVEAQSICAHLSADGLRIEDTPQNVWRLPTVEEAAASLTRAGHNAGGRWDAATRRAIYNIQPDKESPLWVVYSETIYWWTATEDGPGKAFKIAFNGEVLSMPKQRGLGSLGFRAVRDPLPGESDGVR